ncbi:hypothetical protein KJ909_01780 [Patescibacteria group bacterium]|nr:hypothetical protein [Patescibacteria group bacterium]
MLPKRDRKNSQETINGQQLKLDDALSVAKKAKKKKTLLFFALSLTIGLSFLFSLYRFFAHRSFRLNFSPPSFKKASLSLSQSEKMSLDKPIKALLKDQSSWSIYVVTLHPPLFSWSLNFPSAQQADIVSQLSLLPPALNSPVKEALPQGLTIQETFDPYQLLISLPGQQILILINGPDQSLFPTLVKTIYWQVVRSS